ncbi:MAG: hypothetical protein M1436_03235 [Acidobacteria bacterium]|nr:hypothetical protein [Acidobacteriota bacterium]
MANGFAQPPGSFRPWVYWFWINGNLTRKGITADLEAMERVGIGGVLIMEVDGTPAGSVGFGTRIWRDMFQWACQEAARLGIVINMNNDAGWTGSAGPWITPELSMQMVVYSELSLEGGRRFDGDLPKPRRSTESDGSLSGPGGDFYKDIAVIAFPTPGNTAYRISDIRFKADFDARSTPPVAGNGVGPWSFPMLPVTPEAAPADASIDRERIVDLTAAFREGRLTWDAPAGNWTVMRFGHVSTGRTNHPTSPGGAGLECDKLSKQAAELQFNSFIAELAGLIGPLSDKALVATHVDSWEVGSQNWTPRFGEEFRRRCGYDITPYLPVIAGRVVGDIEISERFLWDLRKTVSDMIAENYVGHLRELAKRRGLSFSCEAYDGDPLDEMRVAGESDTPQSEFWYRRETQPVGECGDFTTEYLRTYSWTPTMASAAHIYGRRLVPAEAFTAVPGENWLAHPALMKPQGDWAFCAGINRFIFHRYAMQPWLNRKPGMTMAYWGVHYERTQTWWEETKPWHEYLTRCQYLLQKGLFVADLLYMQAEGAPNRFMPPGVNYSNPVPPDPPGYNFDGCTADVVFKRVSIKDGRIVLPDGMSYRAMVLPGPGEQVMAGVMTPELARRIETLVNDGMTVIGPPPLKSPSLTNYPQCETELKEIVNRLWGDARAPGERRVGKGRVIWGKKPQEVLAAMGVPVDFSCGDPPPFRYIHRRAEDGSEIYFVANKRGAPVEAVCNFRVCGRRPEFWWPETGSIEKPAMYSEANGVASLPIRLSDFGSVFVVFRPNSAPEADRLTGVTRDGNALATGIGGMIQVSRAPSGGFESLVWQAGRYTLRTATGATRHVHAPTLPAPVRIAGPWSVRFTPGWGAPERIELPEWVSWSDHCESGVRYFSGKATYTKTIQVEASMLGRGRLVYLDLGSVEVMARVKWNGKELGILWKKPFKIDITGAARAGANSLELTVVNLWPNRLIGDANLPDDCEWGSGGGMAAAMGGPGGGGVQQNISKYPQWLLDGKPSPTGRFTFSIIRVWPKDAPLRKSGLLGPVTLVPAMKA